MLKCYLIDKHCWIDLPNSEISGFDLEKPIIWMSDETGADILYYGVYELDRMKYWVYDLKAQSKCEFKTHIDKFLEQQGITNVEPNDFVVPRM